MTKSLLLYGGFASDTLYHDLWQYNIYSNMWDEITISNDHPLGYKGHQVLLYSEGFIMYGGATWEQTNFTVIDSTTTSTKNSSLSYSTGTSFIRYLDL